MSAYPTERRDSRSSRESALEVQHLKFEKEVGERLTAIETRSETYATREDLANAKLWGVVSILGAVVSGGIALAVVVVRIVVQAN